MRARFRRGPPPPGPALPEIPAEQERADCRQPSDEVGAADPAVGLRLQHHGLYRGS